MRTLRFLVIALLLIGFCETTKQYIVRKIGNATRRCIPISYCKPGHEILPCKVEYTNDICTSCPPGLVQPDYIQSTVDQTITTCFENRNEDNCAAHDIEPSREYGAEACQFAKYCKCNTDECYYGDPCACANTRECGINESLHTNGTCVKCSPGTMKNKTGCGPCFPIQVTVERDKYRTRKTLVPHQNNMIVNDNVENRNREDNDIGGSLDNVEGQNNKNTNDSDSANNNSSRQNALSRTKDIKIKDKYRTGRPLVPHQNNMIVNDNVENRNQDDNDIGGSLDEDEDQNNKNTNDSDFTNNNSSRQNAISRTKDIIIKVKDNEIADELQKLLQKYWIN
ncbi:unnamed protein product [Mytilus edulis]|uniref:Uncharacterized protein n=1 Tax=Mytilus edulis TaxID=6550 RepID=A0A8S3Q0V5_MYTED|nr:unnamed protein product [Mytilus edulis]